MFHIGQPILDLAKISKVHSFCINPDKMEEAHHNHHHHACKKLKNLLQWGTFLLNPAAKQTLDSYLEDYVWNLTLIRYKNLVFLGSRGKETVMTYLIHRISTNQPQHIEKKRKKIKEAKQWWIQAPTNIFNWPGFNEFLFRCTCHPPGN